MGEIGEGMKWESASLAALMPDSVVREAHCVSRSHYVLIGFGLRLRAGGNEKGRFALDIFTHQLSATEALDREEQANYTLVVRASDDCFHEPRPVTRFDPKDNTLLQVEISVLDLNDNPPRFVSRVFTGGVTMEADFGVVFMTVKVCVRPAPRFLFSFSVFACGRKTLQSGDTLKGAQKSAQ